MLRGRLGIASLRALQMSPQFATDVSFLMSVRQLGRWCMICWTQASLFETCDEVLRKTLRFHSFDGTPWRQLVFGSWADASDRPRPDGTRTGGFVITLATEEGVWSGPG